MFHYYMSETDIAVVTRTFQLLDNFNETIIFNDYWFDFNNHLFDFGKVR